MKTCLSPMVLVRYLKELYAFVVVIVNVVVVTAFLEGRKTRLCLHFAELEINIQNGD